MTKSNPSIFQHDCVNDLYFAVFAPELLFHPQSIYIKLTTERKSWLQKLDDNPDELIQFTGSHKRLGLYYEKLWGFFFQQDKQFDLIAQNLVVRDKHSTIGEFDFLFYDLRSQQHCHLEVAIKFYLFFKTLDSHKISIHQYWFGPNSKDTLARKFSHLTTKQSQLNEHIEAQAITKRLGIENPKKLISLKGYLFSQNREEGQPKNFNDKNTIHRYCYWIDFISKKNNADYFLIPKSRWISNTHQQLEAVQNSTIKKRLESSQSPVMIARCIKHENTFIEVERLFICPEAWPYSLIKPYKTLNCSI